MSQYALSSLLLFPVFLPSFSPLSELQGFQIWSVVLGSGKARSVHPFLRSFCVMSGKSFDSFVSHAQRESEDVFFVPSASRIQQAPVAALDYVSRQWTLSAPCLRPFPTSMAIREEQLTDGACNARPQAIPRRFPSFEVMRRKVVLSTHLNPASIWLWGRVAKKGEGGWR